ncbi:MAG: hypothetical protein ACFCUN_12460 [Hyphomicrobiaceae bacterium]
MTTQPTLMSGWRASPPWVRALLVAFAATTAVACLAFVVLNPVSLLMVALVLAIAVGLQLAIVGTVTDYFAAPAELRPQKARSLAIGFGLFVLVALFFAATLVRLGGNVFNRAI